MVIPIKPLQGAVEQVRSVRDQLARVSALLAAPHTAIAEMCECLERAAKLMRGIEASESAAVQTTLAVELASLRRDLAKVNALVQQAAGFYAGCANLLRSSSGYDRNGGTNRLTPTSRVVAEG